mmetsp:Transcript_93084/g.277906  ORF Transcript_93084/g.277906 Transcript_93084/m.277906 type:complete len:226 (-) Transcript_93084:657-1334(-)
MAQTRLSGGPSPRRSYVSKRILGGLILCWKSRRRTRRRTAPTAMPTASWASWRCIASTRGRGAVRTWERGPLPSHHLHLSKVLARLVMQTRLQERLCSRFLQRSSLCRTSRRSKRCPCRSPRRNPAQFSVLTPAAQMLSHCRGPVAGRRGPPHAHCHASCHRDSHNRSQSSAPTPAALMKVPFHEQRGLRCPPTGKRRSWPALPEIPLWSCPSSAKLCWQPSCVS